MTVSCPDLLQVQTLKSQVSEAKDKLTVQQEDVKVLNVKLQTATTDLATTQLALTQANNSLSTQKESAKTNISNLEARIETLEAEVKTLKQEVKEKECVVKERDLNLETLKEQLSEGVEQVVAMEAELNDMDYLKEDAKKTSDQMADLNDELVLTKQQMQDQEEAYNMEKTASDAQVAQLETRLQQSHKQSNMADSLNSNMADILREKDETIAQLEEKLIECDAKIEELTEELRLEIEENTTFQQNLDQSYDDSANAKRELDVVRKEKSELQSMGESIKAQVEKLTQSVNDKETECNNLKSTLEREEEDIVEKDKDNQRLKELVEKYRAQAECRTEDAQEAQQSTKALHVRLQELSQQNHELAKKCAAMARDLVASNNRASQLEQQLDEQKENSDQDLADKLQELASTRELMDDLQEKLRGTEMEAAETQKLLDSQLAEVTATDYQQEEKQANKSEEEFDDLQQRHDKLLQEVKRLRSELKEAHDSIDDMEISSTGLKQQLKAMEADHENQVALMGSRVQDLASKLAASDKRIRKFERKAARKGKKKEDKENVDGEIKEVDETIEISLQQELQAATMPHNVETDLANTDLNSSSSSGTSSAGDRLQYDTVISAFDASKIPHETIEEDDDLSDNDHMEESEHQSVIQRLENQLLLSEKKVQDLEEQSNIDTSELQQSQQRLREQNEAYRDKIATLETQLSTNSAEDKDSINVASHMQEVEIKLSHTQTVLEECRYKLQDVIQDLGASGIIPSQESSQNYALTITHIRSKLRDILQDSSVEENEEKELKSKLDYNGRLNLFAEKLSLEAVVVGEMAYLVKTSQNEMMSKREDYLAEIQEANSCIMQLEHRVNMLQTQSRSQAMKLRGQQKDSLVIYSGLLAEKIVLQGKLTLLLDRYNQIAEESQKVGSQSSGASTAHSFSKEALFRTKLDEKLYKTEMGQGDGARDFEAHASSLASQALAQGELAFILSKLKERMSDSMTDQERIDLFEQELELAQQRLRERQSNMSEAVEAYQMDWLEQLATSLAQDVALGSPHSSATDSDCQTVDKQVLETEMVMQIRKHAESYRQNLCGHRRDSSESDNRQHALIETAVKQEIDHTLRSLTDIYEEKLEEMTDRSDLGAGDAETSHTTSSSVFQTDILPKFSEVLAQKAVISGHIAHIMEQISMSPDQVPPGGRPSDYGEVPNALRRQDSGVIVHSGSLPNSPDYDNSANTSPTQQDTEIQAMANRLARDATSRQELATYLQQYSQTEPHGSDEVKSQIAKVAADLMNVDMGLVRQHKSVHDYAQIITREAIFHAQMSYVVNKLKMDHETEMQSLTNELGSVQRRVVPDNSIRDLEKEVQRLSGIISQNDILLKVDTDDAQKQLDKLKQEFESREGEFQNEIDTVENKYHHQVEEMQQDIREAEQEMEKVQEEKNMEIQDFVKRIGELEDELNKMREELDYEHDDKEAEVEHFSKRIEVLEDILTEAKNDLQTALKEKNDEREKYEQRIGAQEDDIENLQDSHQRELEQARADMKMAMKAMSTQDTETLEKEMRKMKEKLDEERQRHVVSRSANAPISVKALGPTCITGDVVNALGTPIHAPQGMLLMHLSVKPLGHPYMHYWVCC